jgi:cell division protein ZapA
MLLLAALLLADEVHELKSGKGTAPAAPDRSALLREMAKSLDGTAARIEKLATRLEQSAANP